MEDRAIGILTLTTVALWTVGVVLVLLSVFVDNLNMGQVGLLSAGLGSTISIRSLARRESQRITDSSRSAFELGRDYERGLAREGVVRSLR